MEVKDFIKWAEERLKNRRHVLPDHLEVATLVDQQHCLDVSVVKAYFDGTRTDWRFKPMFGNNNTKLIAAGFVLVTPTNLKRAIAPYVIRSDNRGDEQLWRRILHYHRYMYNKKWTLLDIPHSSEVYDFLADNPDLDSLYRIARIKQDNGKIRVLEIPSDELKALQTKAVNLIRLYYTEPKFIYGYVKGKSTKDLVKHLLNKQVVMALDLKDAYKNTRAKLFEDNMLRLGMPKAVISELSRLLFYKGILPTGAPSSPTVFNLCFSEADYLINASLRNMNMDFYRYSDNLFMCNKAGESIKKIPKKQCIEAVRRYAKQLGYDTHKFKYERPGRRNKHLGIITNPGFMSCPMEFRKNLRSEILHKGLTSEVRGKIAYVRYVNAEQGKVFDKYVARLRKKGMLK